MMMCPGVELTRRGILAVLTFDRPKSRNALNGPMWTALGTVGQALADDPPRALIIQGAGGHFSSGMDLSPTNPLLQELLPAIGERDVPATRALIGRLKANVHALTLLPFPVIAAIEGACAGGALEVALACDMRVAATSASFSLPETHVGMIPDVGGTVRLTRLVGHARATELVLSGRRLDSATAESWGLINRVVEDGEAFEAAVELAMACCRAAPGSTRAVLPVLRESPGLTDVDAFEAETMAGIAALHGGEVMEGTMAFMQKRAPSWVPTE